MCGRYYLGESEETSYWIDKTMQSSLVKEWQKWTGVKTSGEIRLKDLVNEWIRPDAVPGELVKEVLTDIYAERVRLD